MKNRVSDAPQSSILSFCLSVLFLFSIYMYDSLSCYSFLSHPSFRRGTVGYGGFRRFPWAAESVRFLVTEHGWLFSNMDQVFLPLAYWCSVFIYKNELWILMVYLLTQFLSCFRHFFNFAFLDSSVLPHIYSYFIHSRILHSNLLTLLFYIFIFSLF